MTSLLAPSPPFEPPTFLYTLLTEPLKTTLRLLDLFFSTLHTPLKPAHPPIRLVCIPDTHNLIPDEPIPLGDILIHAGDLTNTGTPTELQTQINWLHTLPHAHKILIAGNHDTHLDPRSRLTLPPLDQT